MSMDRHEPFEELISASLRDELTTEERQRLDAHLDTCERCRATLAAFSDQRRIVAGLRHVAPPRDLGARVRAGIDSGAGRDLPWWRRRPVIFAGVGGGLAAVAGALLAIVLLNGTPSSPVGQSSPTISPSEAPSVAATSSIAPSTAPSVIPSAAATPTEAPIPPSPEPDVVLALTGSVQEPTFSVQDAAGQELVRTTPPSGEPIAAALSPDGQWLAYITNVGSKGTIEVRATRIAQAQAWNDPDAAPPIDWPVPVGETVVLGEGQPGSPFLEHLFWSPESRYLAYTLADVEDPDAGTDVWIFQPQTGEPARLTSTGTAYAGSWAAGDSGTSYLWVSAAGDVPESYLIPFHDDSTDIVPGDPADRPFRHAEHVFQPLLSPDGSYVIYWDGGMEQQGAEWVFTRGGQPVLGTNVADGQGGFEFTDTRPLFSDVTVERDGFTSAAITWGTASDAFAVWDAAWTGLPQGVGNAYPDRERIYFSHASDPALVRSDHALDSGDLPDGGVVVDVAVSPTGRHLVVTAAQPRAGELDPPHADLLLITRNTGQAADDVQQLRSAGDGWFGPAAFDELP